jgi:large subunit ribosomal protein L25
MTTIQIATQTRKPKETKKQGSIPAVYYGAHQSSTPIFVDALAFSKALEIAGESSTIVLETENGKENAMIHDVQFHPVKGNPIHADFYVLEKGQKIEVDVPLVFVGESNAVKGGGILVKVLHDLSVKADPTNLPHEFVVDLTLLTSMDSVIHVKDIAIPSGVVLSHISPDDVVASVAAAEEIAEEVTPAADLSAIEVEKKGKKEEEGEAPAA